METGKSRGKVRCPRCGTYHYPTGWQGNTPGLPDLYVHSTSKCWQSTALAIELKAEKGKVSDVQNYFASSGLTTICRSLEEVIELLFTVEARYNNWLAVDRLTKFMENNGIRRTKG